MWHAPRFLLADSARGGRAASGSYAAATLALEDWAAIEPYATPVCWLRCFHGIDTVTAMTLVTELHDFRRFRRPRELMSYLGLIPSEHSSGRAGETRPCAESAERSASRRTK